MARDTRDVESGHGEGRHRRMPLPRTRWAITGFMFGVTTAGWAGLGRGTGDGSIDGAFRKVTQTVQDATESVRDKYAQTRTTVMNQNLEKQIAARLSQDTEIDAERIEVSVEGDGTAVLKGQVPNEGDKQQACDLVCKTKGVNKVVDHLAVTPEPRVIAATQDDDLESTAPRRRSTSR